MKMTLARSGNALRKPEVRQPALQTGAFSEVLFQSKPMKQNIPYVRFSAPPRCIVCRSWREGDLVFVWFEHTPIISNRSLFLNLTLRLWCEYENQMSSSLTDFHPSSTWDESAIRRFVKDTSPLIQVRIGRILLRCRKGMSIEQVRQETEDLCQETFALLFAHNARVLKTWDETKGLSLKNFVGLIAERVALSWFRTGRKNAWRETPMDEIDLKKSADSGLEDHRENRVLSQSPGSPESHVANRQALEKVISRLKEELPPNGLQVFFLIYVEGKSTEEVCDIMNLKIDTVYSWRSRLLKRTHALLTELHAEPRAVSVGM
jgi:RNA polymerase sigma-70 factor (ECF subfamily)